MIPNSKIETHHLWPSSKTKSHQLFPENSPSTHSIPTSSKNLHLSCCLNIALASQDIKLETMLNMLSLLGSNTKSLEEIEPKSTSLQLDTPCSRCLTKRLEEWDCQPRSGLETVTVSSWKNVEESSKNTSIEFLKVTKVCSFDSSSK